MKRLNAVLVMSALFLITGCNKESEEVKYLNTINDALKDEIIKTPHDAISFLSGKGYDIESNQFKDKGYTFGYDLDAKKFLLLKDDEIAITGKDYKENTNTYKIFKVVDNYDNRSTYSQYLTKNFKGSDLLVVTTGLDMGDNTNVKNINYFNSSGNKKEVLLNITCDYLNVNAPLDNITQYGSANNVFVPANTTTGEFHEYGECCYIQVSGGTFYLEDGSYTDLFEIPDGYENKVTIKQAENSSVLARFNADITATSTIRCCEISDADITAGNLQTLLNNTDYNFYRLNTEARDIYLAQSSIEFTRDLFFDLNGRSITFDRGAEAGVKFDDDPTVYYQAIYVHSNHEAEESINVFLIDTQSSLYQRSGINLLDCAIIIEGNNNENKPVNFYMNSGKIHDVKCTQNLDTPRNIAAVLVMGNVQNNKDRVAKYATFNMYGGYIKTEWGAKAEEIVTGKDYKYKSQIACKCIQPRGYGAVVNMMYGDLESYNYCISGQGKPAGNVDRYGKTEINITGGYITGGTDIGYEGTKELGYVYTPLFFPQSGNVKISGATFTGPSCINAKSGNIEITGGVFNATKDPYDNEAKAGNSGSTADGSVIFMESNGYYQGAIDSPLNIKVTNATMTTKTGYILKDSGYSYNNKYSKATINFEGGTFNYCIDKQATDLSEELSKEYYECNINGGTWNKVVE